MIDSSKHVIVTQENTQQLFDLIYDFKKKNYRIKYILFWSKMKLKKKLTILSIVLIIVVGCTQKHHIQIDLK